MAKKMKLNLMNALKSTLMELASHTDCILIYGVDEITESEFCKPINILRNRMRLLACSTIDIRALSYYAHAQKHFVKWLKKHVRMPPNGGCWWNLTDDNKWLRYNISNDLYVVRLTCAKITYYILLRDIYLTHFRKIAFKHG